MFCEEQITEVLFGQVDSDDYRFKDFLDCYYELAYHVEEGACLYLLTDHYVITLNEMGVTLSKKPLVLKEDEWLRETVTDENPTWRALEATLFVGQRLTKVERLDGQYLLHFDDFVLKLLPYECGELKFGLYEPDDLPVLGCDHQLQRRCSCGGEGEILMDFVSDFIVRCKTCKKATWAEMNLYLAIEAWNQGETPARMETVKEKFIRQRKEPIQKIEVDPSELLSYDGTTCVAMQIELCFSDCSYFVSSHKVSDSRSELELRRRDVVIHRKKQHQISVDKGNLRFVTEKCRGGKTELWLTLNEDYLRITTDGRFIKIESIPYNPDGNPYAPKRKMLFDDEPDGIINAETYDV